MSNTKSNDNRILPNFFCIGVNRGGTTWLYEMLKSHSEVYLSSYRKETHFFYMHYDKGLNWYKKFFPHKNESKKYKTIGEIDPNYIRYERAAERIHNLLPKSSLIIFLRNPIDRAISNLKFRYKWGINTNPKKNKLHKEYSFGLYYQQIKIWMNYFSRDQFLILIFEEVMKEPLKALKSIANFIHIDYKKFDKNLLKKKVNPSELNPKFQRVFMIAYRLHEFLILNDLLRFNKILYLIYKKLNFLDKKKDNKNSYIETYIKKHIFLKYKNNAEEYRKSLIDLEEFLGKDLSIWKNKYKNILYS